MTAKGKINASKVQAGDRIIVREVDSSFERTDTVRPSQTKTGEGVRVAWVIEKLKVTNARGYIVVTSAGRFYAEPIQTMWLAPEDTAGIKRAYGEAVAEDTERHAAKVAAREAERAQVQAEHGAEEAASEVARTQTRQVEGWLARHRAVGTPRTQWSPVEDGRLADWDEALATNEVNSDELPDPDGSNTLPIPAGPWFPEAGASVPEANRHVSQTSGVQHLVEIDEAHRLPQERTGSAVVRLLEKVWTRIRDNHPELPQVVIVTGAGTTAGSNKWGHFRADGWTAKAAAEEGAKVRMHEMFMAGETLAKGARQVLQTMLHEGAHTLARIREVQDTSRQGRWHNKEFRKLAAEIGLEHKADSADKAHGYSFVTLTSATVEEYRDLLAELDREIVLMVSLPGWLGGDRDEDDKGGELIGKKPPVTGGTSTNNVKLVCQCEEPNIIRASRKVADKGVLRCDDCEQAFSVA